MNTWMLLIVAFVSGFGSGTILCGIRLEARLRLYRRFIEDRLGSIDLRAALAQGRDVQYSEAPVQAFNHWRSAEQDQA
jgi:hypothetical protein